VADYISVTQYAEKHGLHVGRVRLLIAQGRIPAVKIGNQWAIQADTPKPDDKRVKDGRYRNWRNPPPENGIICQDKAH